MAAIFFKLGQNYYEASFPSHISFVCVNLMKLAAIFQDSEHFLFFKMRPNFADMFS